MGTQLLGGPPPVAPGTVLLATSVFSTTVLLTFTFTTPSTGSIVFQGYMLNATGSVAIIVNGVTKTLGLSGGYLECSVGFTGLPGNTLTSMQVGPNAGTLAGNFVLLAG
jgi:hypothetical protein